MSLSFLAMLKMILFLKGMCGSLFFLMLTSVDQFSIHNRVPERMLFVDL